MTNKSSSMNDWMNNEWTVFVVDGDDDVWLQSSKMKEMNKRNNMISFHSLLLLLLLMIMKKKIDSHHADHNNNNKKNTRDAMISIHQQQQQQEERHTPVPFMPFQCVSMCVNSFFDFNVLLLFLQRRHNSFQTQASHFFVFWLLLLYFFLHQER